ncbi:hypothetical protein [Ligilactobacillus equi]|uniref:Uncharacterized protein n=1 Tax=Ligilactobacillus equi DSM 15833 = JCM 10991 TaxID=1423740 RepID=A0A0R1TEL1_9LACO|nr:hypothetical protein [Ligilactobacillus equi]KRL79735.1 hypothetical protein FC36_GL000364 [Ligilactobacillus equi DSM 15833 = JCM 10991]
MFNVINTNTDEILGTFNTAEEARFFAVDLEIDYMRKEFPNYEEENGVNYDEMPDYEILENSVYEVWKDGAEVSNY